jgi:PAS domain S-box-containing protein
LPDGSFLSVEEFMTLRIGAKNLSPMRRPILVPPSEDAISDVFARSERDSLRELSRAHLFNPSGNLAIGVLVGALDRTIVVISSQNAPSADERSPLHPRQAEAALAASEARLRRSQELGGAQPYEWDLASNAVLALPGLASLFGLPADQPLTYDGLLARIHPEDRSRIRVANQQAVWSKSSYEQEFRVILPDGRVRWILSRGEVVYDDNRQPTTLAGVALDITRRKQAEIALAQRETELAASERRFRVLADAMPQIVWTTRPDGYHDYFNHRWYEFTGVPEGSTYGNEWSELFHPDDRERTWAKWHRALVTGEAYEIEYRLRHRSGEYRWVLGRALPMRNEHGEIEGWFGTCTDIHDLKKTQQALAESEEFTRRLLSSSDDCIAVLDLDGRLLFMNEGGQRVMEVGDFSQVTGSHWPSVCSAADEVRAAIEVAKAGGTGRFQGLCPTVAGTSKWWDVLVTPMKGPDGRPERLLWVSRDITERKQAEDRIAETVERYRLAARATNDATWDWDLATDHIQWNEAVQILFGYTPEEVGPSGRWWKEHIHPEDRERVVQDIHAVIDGQASNWSAEYRFLKADGSYAAIFDRGYVLRDESGRAVRMIGAMLDMTGRKQAEEAERQLAAIIESSDDAILSMDLTGAIASWNRGAERLYGYRAEEVIGEPVSILIPEDRQDEEAELLERSGRGERVEHFETVRRRKEGDLVEVSLTVSAVRDRQGRIIGTSKIARDITERKRLEEQLLLVNRELHHRVKNTLATVQAVISSTARRAQTIAEFQQAVTERITSLARTHTLLIEKDRCGASLQDILRSELAPYDDGSGQRVRLDGPEIRLPSEIAVAFGMGIHELTTNAAKYGAFSFPTGCVEVTWNLEKLTDGCRLTLKWQERGGPPVKQPERQGFGSVLLQRALGRQLGGEVETDFAPDGLRVRISATLPPESQK